MPRKKNYTFKSSKNLGMEITASEGTLYTIAILAKEAAEVERIKKHMALHENYQQIYEEIMQFLKEGSKND